MAKSLFSGRAYKNDENQPVRDPEFEAFMKGFDFGPDISLGADEIVAFILSVILSVTAMSLFDDGIVKTILICLGLNIVSFAVCHFVNIFRFFGTFGIIIYMIIYFMIIFRCIFSAEIDTGVYFWQWMVSGGDIESL